MFSTTTLSVYIYKKICKRASNKLKKNHFSVAEICAISINRTHSVMVVYSCPVQDQGGPPVVCDHLILKLYLIDFESNTWNLLSSAIANITYGCSLAASVNKRGNRYTI